MRYQQQSGLRQEDFLFNYMFLEDQRYCEQNLLEILQAQGPQKFILEFRIIKQDTGVVHKQRVLVQRVEDGENNLIGLRVATTDCGPV